MGRRIEIGRKGDFESRELWDMYKLRARVFHDRMGWDVPVLSGMEVDGYDALDPYYLMIRGNGGICGCWRILPTTGPYMLKDTFPQLLHDQSAPQADNVWELSRFAIETENASGFGFTDLVISAMREIAIFGEQMGIQEFVTVTTTPIERLIKRLGLPITRFGPPIQIGVERAVALTLATGEIAQQVLFDDRKIAA